MIFIEIIPGSYIIYPNGYIIEMAYYTKKETHKLSRPDFIPPQFIHLLREILNNIYIVSFHTVFYSHSDKGALHTLWLEKGRCREKNVRVLTRSGDNHQMNWRSVMTGLWAGLYNCQQDDKDAGSGVVAERPANQGVMKKEEIYVKVAYYWKITDTNGRVARA